MDLNLLKSLSSYVTPDLISKASSMLGESEDNVSKGMSLAIPTLLGGLAGKADNSNIMDGIMNLVNQDGFDSDSVLSNLSSLVSGKGNQSVLDSGGSLLKMLFGDQQSGVFDMLGKSSGLNSSTITKLMAMAAPMLLGFVKKSGLNASSLTKLLTSQKGEIGSLLPKGFNSLMGFGDSIGDGVKKAMDDISDAVPEKPKNKWLLPIIIIAGALILFYFFRNCNGDASETPAINKIEATTDAAIYAKATKAELDESFELGANPDAETIAKFQEKANKTFTMQRAYCYDEEGWLNSSWDTNIDVSATAASYHKEKTGHSTGVRWK
jgi:hypothetical protein